VVGVLSQYEKFVKPSFEEYVSPVPISSSHLLLLRRLRSYLPFSLFVVATSLSALTFPYVR
jgi:hypothetical protein